MTCAGEPVTVRRTFWDGFDPCFLKCLQECDFGVNINIAVHGHRDCRGCSVLERKNWCIITLACELNQYKQSFKVFLLNLEHLLFTVLHTRSSLSHFKLEMVPTLNGSHTYQAHLP